MSLVMTAAPAVEPITLAEAKAHLRIDDTAQDAYITSLIVTSRLQIEAALGLALITQGWRWTIDTWPEAYALELPIRPVQSITALEIAHLSGPPTTLSPTDYVLDGNAAPARLVLTNPPPPYPDAPAGGISIALTAGFGNAGAEVPRPIRHALLLLVAHWFECREPAGGDTKAAPIPDVVSDLLAQFRVVRL